MMRTLTTALVFFPPFDLPPLGISLAQVWLEPEGLDTHLVYPNGISGAYPPAVQALIVASIPGLEEARIVQPAYDVEYEYIDPRAVRIGRVGVSVRQCGRVEAGGAAARALERGGSVNTSTPERQGGGEGASSPRTTCTSLAPPPPPPVSPPSVRRSFTPSRRVPAAVYS